MAPVGCIHEGQHCAACNSSQDLSSIALDKKGTVCRFYQTGNCRRGSNCPFTHISTASQVETLTISHPTYPTSEHMYVYYPLRHTPPFYPLGSRPRPAFLWQPYVPLSPSYDPRYGTVCPTEHLSDHPDDKSDPSSAESSSTAASTDRQPRMALDTPWLEGTESEVNQAVPVSPGDVGISLSPGYAGYSYPIFPGVETERVAGGDRATSGQYPDQGPVAAHPSPIAPPWQDGARKKPLAYKTKPCKFYTENGECTSGEKCTFIHDPEPKGSAKKPPPSIAPLTGAQLPPKPLDKYEDSRARDFYPITWRVIGGGVMMGGQRQICPAFAGGRCKYGNDCKLAHETELATDEIGFIELKGEPVRKGDASPQRLTKGTAAKRVRLGSQRKSTKVPPPATVNFPSATPRPQRPDVPTLEGEEAARKKSDEAVVSSTPPSPVHRRTQSMTMVGKSPPPLDTTHSSHAAEL